MPPSCPGSRSSTGVVPFDRECPSWLEAKTMPVASGRYSRTGGPAEFPERCHELAVAVFTVPTAEPVLAAGTDTGHRPVPADQPEALRPHLHRTILLNGQMHASAHDVALLGFRFQGAGDHGHVETAVTLVLDDPDTV